MSYICDDRDSKWYFQDGLYVRVYTDKSTKKIRPSNIPDPEKLLDQRIKNAMRNGLPIDVALMRPTKAVYKLWDHKLENSL